MTRLRPWKLFVLGDPGIPAENNAGRNVKAKMWKITNSATCFLLYRSILNSTQQNLTRQFHQMSDDSESSKFDGGYQMVVTLVEMMVVETILITIEHFEIPNFFSES